MKQTDCWMNWMISVTPNERFILKCKVNKASVSTNTLKQRKKRVKGIARSENT